MSNRAGARQRPVPGRRSCSAAPRRSEAVVPIVLIILALAALAGAGIIVLRPALTPSAAAQPAQGPADAGAPAAAPGSQAAQVHQPVTAEDGAVRLALADISDGRAHFYTFQAGGKAIPFFVLKSSDGVIRAAFDACDVCFPARKGYHQEGDEMVCNNCGTRFPSASINEVRGGCNPAPLTRQVQGDRVIIQASDLLAGARYF